MISRRQQLLAWVAEQHAGQLIKQTTEPYLDHLAAVAETADIMPLGYETGLCHDLLEETSVSTSTLLSSLIHFGYEEAAAGAIVSSVIELTHVFTKNAYPDWRKSDRKAKEAERLAGTGPLTQTVACADLIYNIGWMLAYDPQHAKKYLKKKRKLLLRLTHADPSLQSQALQKIDAALSHGPY